MIVHKSNGNTGKVTPLFDAEYVGIKRGKAVFVGNGGYIEGIGPYENSYRLDFLDKDELKEFIDDLVELYKFKED